MGIKTGVSVLGAYAPTALTTAGDRALVQAEIAKMIALIPDPDTPPAQSGGNFLDAMSPQAAAQLIVDLEALSATFSGP